MTLLIQSWCGGDPCDPCKPPPPPPPPPPGTGTTFTDASININQTQINTDLRGNMSNHILGSMIIYSAIDNIPPQGHFGVPLSFGPPSTSSIANSVVVYRSFITIRHPYYPDGSYNDQLPDVTTGPLTPTVSSGDGSGAANQSASTAAGNAAIAQANGILSRGYL